MPTFTKVVGDTFTHANENPMVDGDNGTNTWATATGNSAFQILSNTANVSTGASDCASYYVGTTFNSDQYSRGNLTITSATSGGNRGIGLRVRQQSAANTLYQFVIDHNVTTNAFIQRFVAGSFTALDSWLQSFTDGDQFTFAVEGTGTSTVLRVYDKTLTLVRTFTDSAAHTSIDNGAPGLGYSSAEGSNPIAVDNWEGGNFASASDTLLGQAVM